MEWGSAVVVLYAHTNWFFKCRAVYCQGGVDMQSVTASGRLAKKRSGTGNANAGKARVERECHELAGCRAAAAAQITPAITR